MTMKTNWQTKKLSELIDEGFVQLTRGKVISKKDIAAHPGTYPIYSSAKNNDGMFGRYGKFMFDEPLITWSVDGGGRLFYRPKHKFSVTNVGGVLRILKPALLDYQYLFYVLSLKHSEIRFDWVKKAHPSIIRELYKGIPLPPLKRQKQIVKELEEVFEKVAKAKENVEKNLQNSKELFEAYARGAFINPGDWSIKSLGEVCNLYQGIAINAKTRHALVEKSELPLLRIKDLKNNAVEQYIDPNNYPKNALVIETDLIYTRTGQIGLVFTGKRGVLHNNSFKIEPNHTLSREYLFHWLQNPTFKSKIISLASRVAQPDITHTLFKQQLIAIPSLTEQKSIVKKLDVLSTETKKLEAIYKQKLTDLEELKKSILKRAFSGDL